MLSKMNGILKKRKGFGLLDLGLYAIALTILVAAGVAAYNEYQEGNKRAVARQELKTIASACSLYMVTARSGNPPAELGDLVTGLTAAQSNDGIAKGRFVAKTTWTNTASFVDPWGNAYGYNAATQTVTCTNNGGTAFSETF